VASVASAILDATGVYSRNLPMWLLKPSAALNGRDSPGLAVN